MSKNTLDDLIAEELKDRVFQGHYEKELLINAIAKMTVDLRLSASLTQAELAERVGTSQAAIARLESGKDSRVPSLYLLARIAEASNAKLNLSFEPKD